MDCATRNPEEAGPAKLAGPGSGIARSRLLHLQPRQIGDEVALDLRGAGRDGGGAGVAAGDVGVKGVIHMMCCLRVAALAALASVLPASAKAETTWEVFQRFGLTGTWAESCNHPPSARNPWMSSIAQPNGSVRRKFDAGGGTIRMLAVDSAEITDGDTLHARLRNDGPEWGAANGLYFDVAMQKSADGAIRTFQSKGSDGKQYINDGIYTSTRTPVPWQYKCRE
jgi:hypothetical protein